MRKFLAGGLLLLSACSGLTSSPASPVLPPAWDWTPTKGGMAASDPVKLVRDFPDSSAARLRLLNSQVEAGDQKGVLQSLAWLNGHGHQFSPDRESGCAIWWRAGRCRFRLWPNRCL